MTSLSLSRKSPETQFHSMAQKSSHKAMLGFQVKRPKASCGNNSNSKSNSYPSENFYQENDVKYRIHYNQYLSAIN